MKNKPVQRIDPEMDNLLSSISKEYGGIGKRAASKILARKIQLKKKTQPMVIEFDFKI